MNHIIEVCNLVKRFAENRVEKVVLDNISFKIREKEVIAFMGESGVGKTTLMNIIASLDSNYDGNIMFQGKPLKSFTEDEISRYRTNDIGIIKQNGKLIEYLTVYENLLLSWGESKGFTIQDKTEKIDRIMQVFGILSRLDKKVSEISGGEYQRCVWARALVKNPKVLIADEPTSALDIENASNMITFITEIRDKENITAIIMTHDIQIAAYADRIIYLKEGKVKFELQKKDFGEDEYVKKIISNIYS